MSVESCGILWVLIRPDINMLRQLLVLMFVVPKVLWFFSISQLLVGLAHSPVVQVILHMSLRKGI